MDPLSRMFEQCYNDIVVHNLPKALESFQAAYRDHPKHRPFLHGIIITSLLLGKTTDMVSFLEKEKTLSSHHAFIESILYFFIDNKLLNSKSPDIFYNTALFVREQISAREGRLYFRVGRVVEPSNPRFLVGMAEYCMTDGNYAKGLRLYSQAAQMERNSR